MTNTKSRETAAKLPYRVVLFLVFLFIGAVPSWGQAAPTAHDTPATSSTSPSSKTADSSTPNSPADSTPATSAKTPAQTNAAILEELERMGARIAELEAQLKQQSDGTAATTNAALNSQPNPSPEESSSLVAAANSGSSAAPLAPSPAQPKSIHLTGGTDTADNTGNAKSEPFAFADFTWLNGNGGPKDLPLDTKFFTPEIRADVDYIYDFNHPQDDTIGGSSEVFRAQEFHVTQLGVGGDFHFDNVQARVMTQFGMYAETTPRNDASPGRGSWDLDTAYRYVSEAYGGYHFNWLHGVNVQAGIFMSYIGLFSYYNFDNWAYQPSYVSSNTPWFFNGMRVQIFPSNKLKIEPWLINGWQSYGRFDHRPGVGAQILWRPTGWFEFVGNQYFLGADTLFTPGRIRYHTDDSIEIKYYDRPDNTLDKMAFSLTGDAGCEHGGGVSCDTNSAKGPKQDFLGFMFYNRWWFNRDKFGLTVGGGAINNPGRYLVLLPPINGATAVTGTPYFTENPGQPFKASDVSGTFDYMPSQYVIFRFEFDHRQANVPYFTGRGGITPPGGDNGNPGSFVSLPGSTCMGSANTWCPDLRRDENRLDLALLVKF